MLSLTGISNIPQVSLAIMIMTDDSDYKKSNYHYSSGKSDEFSVWSRKGYEDVLAQFEIYKTQQNSDTILYRNFKPEWWKIWRWGFFLSENRYQLPFKEMPADAFQVSRGVTVK